jgi:hypothetical protein
MDRVEHAPAYPAVQVARQDSDQAREEDAAQSQEDRQRQHLQAAAVVRHPAVGQGERQLKERTGDQQANEDANQRGDRFGAESEIGADEGVHQRADQS